MVWLFIFGAIIGSFLNVLAVRYDPDHSLVDRRVIGGRSRCPHCKKTLRWFELLPFVSYVIQGGRCLRCRKRLSSQYFIVELLSGCIFAFVPFRLGAPLGPALLTTNYSLQTILWVLVFLSLLLITLIDLRLMLIPDELEAVLVLCGLALALVAEPAFPSRLIAALLAGGAFLALVVGTKGKGMGEGDVKLAASLGLVFGLPAIIPLIGGAFIIGAIVGGGLVLLRRKTLKSAVPFGPFLAASAALVFFFGDRLLSFPFHLALA